MAQAIPHAERSKTFFALLFVDLDKFKLVNDLYGHSIGDGLLKAVARRLDECIRKEDTVARAGGDEFVIVLREISHTKDAAKIGGKIVQALAHPFQVGRHELDISCSVGISVYPKDGKDINTLMINADTAMYQAKRAGRNAYKFFIPSSAVASNQTQ